jgi:hypothetical protein
LLRIRWKVFTESLLSNGHSADPHRKHLLQHLLYCCVRVLRALPSNISTLLLVAYLSQAGLPSCCLAMGICFTISSGVEPAIVLQPTTLLRGIITIPFASLFRPFFASLTDCTFKCKVMIHLVLMVLSESHFWTAEQLQVLCADIAAAADLSFLANLAPTEAWWMTVSTENCCNWR